MNSNELEVVVKNIVNLKLDVIGIACEMLMFNFDKYSVHSQCLTRVIKGDDILVTSCDYQSWDGEISENNDERLNLNKFRKEIEGGKVVSVQILPWFDLIITMDNGVVIQILIENSYAHYDNEREQYRFMEVDEENEDASKHYVVYNKHIEEDF